MRVGAGDARQIEPLCELLRRSVVGRRTAGIVHFDQVNLLQQSVIQRVAFVRMGQNDQAALGVNLVDNFRARTGINLFFQKQPDDIAFFTLVFGGDNHGWPVFARQPAGIRGTANSVVVGHDKKIDAKRARLCQNPAGGQNGVKRPPGMHVEQAGDRHEFRLSLQRTDG